MKYIKKKFRKLSCVIKYPWLYIKYYKSLYLYYKKSKKNGVSPPAIKDRYLCLGDDTSVTAYDRHYVYHTSWAARHLESKRPSTHIDIGSDLRFVTLVSAFVPIRHYDYRPPQINLSGLKVGMADLKNLPFETNSITSISCMHVVEHVGLGRYGDDLDPKGDIQAMSELSRVVSSGGDLYIVVPVGVPKTCFNAHRIYSYSFILGCFEGFTLESFALIPDSPKIGHLVYDAEESLVNKQQYGCGCFLFRKN